MQNTFTKPFLKWAGGKFALLNRILPKLPPANCLIEPCVGSGAVFLNTDYKRYILNDANPDLINLYKQLKKAPQHFIEQARPFFTARYNQETVYYKLRERFNNSDDPVERALLFFYLNRHGYNGLCRYNQQGQFNVPFGRYKRPYFPEEEMLFFAKKAKKARFLCQDFQKVMQKAEPDQVIYCDPPYVPLSQTARFTQYCQAGFNHADQTTLAELARDLKHRGISTIISNHDTPITRKLYRGAKISKFQQRRYISCKTDRTLANELVACFIG